MSEKISVLIKEPGKVPRHVYISNTLESLQKTVGGYIETVTLADEGLVIICNEEGRIFGLPYNCEICGVSFVGTIVLCGVNGEELADLPMTWHRAKQLFPKLWKTET